MNELGDYSFANDMVCPYSFIVLEPDAHIVNFLITMAIDSKVQYQNPIHSCW